MTTFFPYSYIPTLITAYLPLPQTFSSHNQVLAAEPWLTTLPLPCMDIVGINHLNKY